ncbi:MAG: hypothetical protein AAB613_02690 [Patescibacteria group bacterium]
MSKHDLTKFYQSISEMGRLEIAKRRAKGETIGQAPLGFRKVQVNDRSTIAPDPETFPLLTLALQMRQDGCTLREVCSLMARKGLRSRRGKLIQPNGMDRLLKTFGQLVKIA